MASDPARLADGGSRIAVGERVGRMFTEHGRMVYGVCRAMLRDPVEAEDATQAAFVSAFTSLERGTRVRDDAAWIATIARHECLGRIRRRMREPVALPDADVAMVETSEDGVDRAIIVAELREAIATLPDNQRAAVVLRDLYGFHYREVGTALGVSRPAVEALLFRARRTLRGRLKPALGAMLVVPLALREGVAQAVPYFATATAAGAGASATAGAGAGLLAKLGAAPVAAKVAAGVVAVAAGSVATVELEARHGPGPAPSRGASTVPLVISPVATAVASPSQSTHNEEDRSGRSGGGETDRRPDDNDQGGRRHDDPSSQNVSDERDDLEAGTGRGGGSGGQGAHGGEGGHRQKTVSSSGPGRGSSQEPLEGKAGEGSSSRGSSGDEEDDASGGDSGNGSEGSGSAGGGADESSDGDSSRGRPEGAGSSVGESPEEKEGSSGKGSPSSEEEASDD